MPCNELPWFDPDALPDARDPDVTDPDVTDPDVRPRRATPT